MGTEGLRRAALEIFGDVLRRVDAREAVLVSSRLLDFGETSAKIYSVAIGKAAAAMASALEERLGERLARGVISSPSRGAALSARWQRFEGGHPLPNEESLEAARAAFELLREADASRSPVVFLVSGGGSAMLEWPRDGRLTLEDLRDANRVLISCGAGITEVNAVRRALSAVKGGRLAALAPGAKQLTLIISDTGAGREADVASGPTLRPPPDSPRAAEVVGRYGLSARLPPRALSAIEDERDAVEPASDMAATRRHFVLLDNRAACEAAAESARERGFVVETAFDVEEQEVGEGAALLASRLFELYEREGGRAVCFVSGGEFACPVRGGGRGGRNSETALRCAFEFERLSAGRAGGAKPKGVVALCAGTDGVDGNSPAAGALADSTTLVRARLRGLDAATHLLESDAYSFFDSLGDAVVTGPTGTNVRDVRVLLAE